jgi:hypothetical protein
MLAGLAAVLVLAVVVLPWLIGPRSGTSGPEGSTESTLRPTATPTAVPLAHAEKWFLSFDYPAAWTLTDRNVPPMADPAAPVRRSIDAIGEAGSLGFVGTGTASETCQAPGPDYLPRCQTTWILPESSVVVRFWIENGPILWSGQQAIEGARVPDTQTVLVDGLPSLFAKSDSDIVPHPDSGSPDSAPALLDPEQVAGADEVLWWALSTQLGLQQSYVITAAIRGPNTAELEAQVRALVASIHWVPEPYVLPTGPALDGLAHAVVPTALAKLRRTYGYTVDMAHSYDCFPTIPGTSVRSTIVENPYERTLSQPLPVTCTSDIAPNVMQGWTLTLTQTWEAGPDYPAGKQTYVKYLDIGGHVIGDGSDMRPTYPHQTGSKTPG